MEDKLIKRTPCIGVCSTTYGDDICRGCRRFRHEITSWINYSDSEKNIINRRLEKFKVTVLEEKDKVVKAIELSGKDAILYFRDSLSGKVCAKPNKGKFKLNKVLHDNN